jgi:hypothetical protein
MTGEDVAGMVMAIGLGLFFWFLCVNVEPVLCN